MDRLDEVGISATPAQIPIKPLNDFISIRGSVFPQQRHRRQDHAGDTIAALHGLLVDERLLNRMQLTLSAQAFDRFNLEVLDTLNRGETGRNRFTVYQDRAGSTLSLATTVFCPCQIQIFAQNVQQASIRMGSNLTIQSVDLEPEFFFHWSDNSKLA